MAHHNIPLRFRSGGRRLRNFHFHEFPFPFNKKFCRTAANSILMPSTFHIDSLNRYAPNLQGYPKSWPAAVCHEKAERRTLEGDLLENTIVFCHQFLFYGTYIDNITRVFMLLFQREDCSRTKVDLIFHQLRRHQQPFTNNFLGFSSRCEMLAKVSLIKSHYFIF